ncbi:hypothetical protein [Micropruina sp.]|uniref:hypothetical protein n=1 Tax=Micropruina sp. TaxID=2737536 RepID=UPI0026117D2E|nr:hypothetical protein [Micropruina sp.]
MAKRPSKHLRPARPLSQGGFAQLVTKTDGQWMVQTMPGGSATKAYLCPGCSREIPVGAAQLVAWPRDASIGSVSAVADRRHWHTSCWQRRR